VDTLARLHPGTSVVYPNRPEHSVPAAKLLDERNRLHAGSVLPQIAAQAINLALHTRLIDNRNHDAEQCIPGILPVL
jgi:hypothetical protein